MSESMMTVDLRQVSGISFLARAGSGHWVAMDGPTDFGGAEAGSRPLELFLMGLAGCTGMDVVTILTKMRADLADFRIEVKAERAEEHPKVFTEIDLIYHFYGDIKESQAEKAIALSQDRYCGASAMLRPGVEIRHSFEIHPADDSGRAANTNSNQESK